MQNKLKAAACFASSSLGYFLIVAIILSFIWPHTFTSVYDSRLFLLLFFIALFLGELRRQFASDKK